MWGKNIGICIQFFLTVVLFTVSTCCILRCLVCIVVCCLVCIVVVFPLEPDCWLEVSIRKVLRPATSTQVFLGFPVSISKC